MSERFQLRIERSRRLVAAAWLLVILLIAVALYHLAGAAVADRRSLIALLIAAVVLHFVARLLRRWIPRRTILKIDFERGVVEHLPPEGLSRLALGPVMPLRDVIDAIERAREDRRVVGLVARIGPSRLGLAHVQEIREGIAAFRAAGKKTVAWCETLGEQERATADYYLAAAFEEIWLHPGGDLAFNGLLLTQPFVRTLLDRLGVLPQFDHRGRYKTVKYLLTERELTEPHRESLQALLDSQAEQIVSDVARDRGLETSRVRELMDEGLLLGEEAREAGLIDRLEFRHETHEHLRRDLRGRMLEVDSYLDRAGRPHRRGARVALIHSVGNIVRGKSGLRRFGGAAVVGADDLTEAFRKASEDRKVKAIVLRIDSPGGSATASLTIWHAIRQAREAGKPVIASMSNLAGSGGYYIAAAADRIVAHPATITGSIGVVAGKFVTAQAWGKLGVQWNDVRVGEQAAIWSSQEPFSDDGWRRFERLLDRTYDQFKAHVAEGRKLTLEEVEAVAQGRIWSGQQAKAHSLVDELGGLRSALQLAREAAGLPKDAPVHLAEWPPRPRLPSPLWPSAPRNEAAMLGELHAMLTPVHDLFDTLHPLRDGLLVMPGFTDSGAPSNRPS